jgi:HD-like signal output (HDOD) protein
MTRVLFVDDEPRVLDGLRLSLRAKRRVWDMVFFERSDAALEDITKTPLDVVVSDMRMPHMDGAELLARVAELRPEAARIILSGQMDELGAVRAASVAHRFLSKPCDAKVVEAVITQALDLHGWMRSDLLRSRIGGVESLPSLPQAYLALNQALSSAEVSTGAVARIIESDPGMAAKILQLVNSSFFGLSRTMVNITEAVGYLGMSTMKNLTLANSLFHELGTANVRAAEEERERSLLRARIARQLCTKSSTAEAASTAALLLHIGNLALQSRMPHEHEANVMDALARGVPVHEVERERLGVTHAEVGAYLLGLWGLPHEIVEAVAGHHVDWSEITKLDVRSAVCVADVLARQLLPPSDGRAVSEVPPDILERLGLGDIATRVTNEIRATAGRSQP